MVYHLKVKIELMDDIHQGLMIYGCRRCRHYHHQV